MCRNIHTLFNFEPPATEDEVRDAALQYVRKISGFTKPSRANEAAFERAVDEVTAATARLVDGLVTNAPPRDREVEAQRKRERAAKRFATAVGGAHPLRRRRELSRHGGCFLGAREAEHNLILGLSSRLEREPLLYGEPPYLAVAEDEGRIVGVAMRTPPHNLILSEIEEDAAVGLFVEDAREAFDALPGVIGPKARVAQFANGVARGRRRDAAARDLSADLRRRPRRRASAHDGRDARLRARRRP
jgi:hypothetical protein